MYISTQELKSAIYQYQVDQITEADSDITTMAITAAEDEAKGYLRGNNKKEWLDGRLRYDIQAIFSATGNQRHALLMEMIKSIAVWYLIRLCNVDILFDSAKDRYDRAIDWLKKVNKGELTLDLPLLPDDTGSGSEKQPFQFGSRAKFNHE